MPEYTGTVVSPRPPDDVFAYMADFTHTSEWDPNCQQAFKLTDGEIGVGTEFRLVFKRDLDLRYKVTEYDAPRRIVIEGGNDSLQSTDVVEVEPADGGTQVTYTTDISFTGLKKALNPALALAMRKAGGDARDGLEERLG